MTEPEYRALTATCDQLLLAPDASPDRIAVPWLHVLSPHPSNLRHYPNQRQQPDSAAREAARIGRTLQRATAVSGSSPVRGALPASADLLILSHLVNPKHAELAEDFYFGTLANELARTGRSVVTALRNHTSAGERGLGDRLHQAPGAARVLLRRVSRLGRELRSLQRARRIGRELRAAGRTMSDFGRCIANSAADHAITEGTLANLRIEWQVTQLVRRLRPRAVFATFEGHAWERIVFQAARSVDPSIRCLGYQHTILFPLQHAISRTLGRQLDPDVVFTVGDVTRDLLSSHSGLAGVEIQTFGSYRRAAHPMPGARNDTARCLVVPEGFETECMILFDFAIACARQRPDIEFVLRMHPILPFENLERSYPRLRQRPANVQVSNNAAIADDFARCRFALYRGSSSVVHAVLAGLRPVYVERPDEIPIDPLHSLSTWRRRIQSTSELEAIIDRDQADEAARAAELREAQAWAGRYMVQPDPAVIARWLE